MDQGPAQQQDRNAARGSPILVYFPSRWRLLVLTVLSIAFVGGGVYLLDAAKRGFVPPAAGLAGLVTVVFFGACGAYSSRRALAAQRPLLTADEDGLVDDGSAIGAGRLRWQEIDELRLHRFRGHTMLGIVPRDLDAVLARVARWRRLAARANLALGAPPFNIPQSLSKTPLDVVLGEVLHHFGDRLPRVTDPGGHRPAD